MKEAGSLPRCTTVTSGNSWRTSSHSAGLSSQNTKLSIPTFSAAAIRRNPPALSAQEHSNAAKSGRCNTEFGWVNPLAAMSGAFFEHTARITPRSPSAFT